MPILVLYCFCSKLPYTLWLKTIQLLLSSSSESQNFNTGVMGIKRRYWQGYTLFFSWMLQIFFPCLFHLAEAVCDPCLMAMLYFQIQQQWIKPFPHYITLIYVSGSLLYFSEHLCKYW